MNRREQICTLKVLGLDGYTFNTLLSRFVNAFDEEIRAVIEAAISKRVLISAEQLDNYLEALPRFLPIDDVSAIDVTIVQDPLVSPTFLSVGVRGEFTSLGNSSNFTFPDHGLQPGLFCSDSSKMVTIALCDYVINSAANVYYEVHALQTCYLLNIHVHLWSLSFMINLFSDSEAYGSC